jgi:hypothetical protein
VTTARIPRRHSMFANRGAHGATTASPAADGPLWVATTRSCVEKAAIRLFDLAKSANRCIADAQRDEYQEPQWPNSRPRSILLIVSSSAIAAIGDQNWLRLL